jgi:hypothetical protein
MSDEINIDELANLEVRGGDVEDNLCEELGDIPTFGNQLDYISVNFWTEHEPDTHGNKPLHSV